MLHLIWKCFGRLDRIRQMRLPASYLVPFFQRRPRWYSTKPAWIWSGLPSQVLAKFIWSGSKLVSNFQSRMHSSTDSPDHIVQNQPRSNLVLAVSGFGQMDMSGSKPVCKNPWADASEPIRIGCESDLAWFLAGFIQEKNFQNSQTVHKPLQYGMEKQHEGTQLFHTSGKGALPLLQPMADTLSVKTDSKCVLCDFTQQIKINQFLTTVRSWEMQFLTDKLIVFP